jgi:hypothetical protein
MKTVSRAQTGERFIAGAGANPAWRLWLLTGQAIELGFRCLSQYRG